jgi:hypothetical protein
VVNHRRDGEDAAKPFVQTLLALFRQATHAIGRQPAGQ